MHKTIVLLFAAATAIATSSEGLLQVRLIKASSDISNEDAAEEEFKVGAEEEGQGLMGRSADLSGCGVHRTCTACRDQNLPGACYWNPGTGCVKSWIPNQRSMCTAQNNVAPQCSAFQDCNSCTIQNGCVFYRGKCAYSRGTNCESDPQNCVNYSWRCPASPSPIYRNPVPQPAPVQVQTPDRITETVTRVEDMIIGMTAAELRRLRNELDAMLIAAEASAATPAYSYPIYSPYSTAVPAPSSPYSSTTDSLYSQLFGLGWATTASSAQPSSYPAIFAAPVERPVYSAPSPSYAAAGAQFAAVGVGNPYTNMPLSQNRYQANTPMSQNGYQALSSFGNSQWNSQPASQPVWAPASPYSWGR